MIVTTGIAVTGYEISQILGVVRGVIVRAPNIGQNLMGGLQGIFGGNIEAYAQVCDEARGHAYDLMVGHALQMGADAIIGMRYDATEFAPSMTEVLAYGTAVTLKR